MVFAYILVRIRQLQERETPDMNLHKPRILITGATGNIGTELAKLFSAQRVPFRAMVRSSSGADRLAGLEGAEIVIGDFNDEESIAGALKDVERAFLLTNSSEHAESQQSTFVDLARIAGVKHIVKLSQWAADANSPVRFLRYHAAVEQRIKNSGIAYTFLRPNLFMQGLLAFREPIVKQGQFFAAIGEARISAVDVRDIAAVAAAALTRIVTRERSITSPAPKRSHIGRWLKNFLMLSTAR